MSLHQPRGRQGAGRPGFARVQGRPSWAIPWMEDDPALTSPQLWAGRMRRDAADALRYGCDGPPRHPLADARPRANVLALARAAWDKSWPLASRRPSRDPSPGTRLVRAAATIAGAADPAVYRDSALRPLRLSAAGPERVIRGHPALRRAGASPAPAAASSTSCSKGRKVAARTSTSSPAPGPWKGLRPP